MRRLDWSDPRHRRWTFTGAAALALVLAAWALFHKGPAKASEPPAVPVTVATAKRQDIAVSLTELGAAQAWTSVNVLAQVSGRLLTVNFTEGADVKEGDVLAQIDPAPYQAALEQAQGTLNRDRAALADAKLDLARYKRLEALNSIATQLVDTQAALVRQDEGVVQSDEGTVKTATVNLGWTKVVAPVTGRTGVRLVDPGNLVSASGSVGSAAATAAATNASNATPSSGSGIVVVNQIEPIAVTFTVPEGDFQNLAQVSNGFHTPLLARAYSQETGALLDTGELTIADNRIDPSTGTIELKARFPNAKHMLWPGQFVNVQLTLQTLHNVTTVPTTAVNRGPDGAFAYVVGKDKHVTMQPLVVSQTQDTTSIVSKGLKPGEIVVTDGQMILKAGSLVKLPASPHARRAKT
jgi:multidrug efflux system membrane fusion protein